MSTVEELLARIAEAIEAVNQPPKLGLSTGSNRRFLYVGQEQNTCWYFRRDDNNIPVIETSLTGVVKKIEIVEKEFKGKQNLKLQISVDAGTRYCVQSGLETAFSHGFLQAFEQLNVYDKHQIITITVRPGEEKTVFCNLYQDGQRVLFDWDKNVDLNQLAQNIIRNFVK